MPYYVLHSTGDQDGMRMLLNYKKDHRARSFAEGVPFSDAPGTDPWLVVPQEPIILTIQPGRDGAPLPTFFHQPVPLVNAALHDVLRNAGVDNIDFYRAELRHPDGRLESDQYFVFNVIGVVKAVDLGKSEFDASQPDREIAMGFEKAVIDPAAARDLAMFRLAENITTIVVNERVKKAIEDSGIGLLRVDAIEDVAIL